MRGALSAPRAELVAVAARAFADRGYHAVSMRDLARDLGRSPATFYSHFESKEALLYCMQKDAFDTLLENIRAALDGVKQPMKRLRVLVHEHVRYFTENSDVMRVLVHEAAALPAGPRDAIRRRKEAYYALARDVISALVAERAGAGVMDDDEIERATYCLFGMLNWIYGWYTPEDHGSAEELAETIHRIATRGIGVERRRP